MCGTKVPKLRAARASRSVGWLAPLAAMFAVAAVFVGAVETEKVPPSPPADRRREHRESAAVVLASSGKNTSAHSSSVRRRAITDARSSG